MIIKNITKLFIAIVLTVTVTIGSGVVADTLDVSAVPTVYACGSGGGSGGDC